MAEAVYNARVWGRIRIRVLERDGYVCQIGGPGCRGKAEVVDHVQSWREGGAWYDLANLRAACRSCNTAREYRRFEARRRPSREW
jgi:5-methylcytosine-specific restriction enzyme A